jgi:protein-L-isoaspartate(D-aspartate) O-methyltransferase
MAWRCSGSSNKELVENLFRADLIKSSRVRDAMMKVCPLCASPSPIVARQISASTANEGYRLTAHITAQIYHMPMKTLHSPSAT